LGAISITAVLAHKALDLPWKYQDPIARLWAEITQEATDRASAALCHVMGWAHAHREEFLGQRARNLPPPTRGWAGRWGALGDIPGGDDLDDEPEDEGEEDQMDVEEHQGNDSEEEPRVVAGGWQWIGFYPQVLDDVLRDGHYEPKSTIRIWKARGWLRVGRGDEAARCQRKVRVGATSTRLVVITRAGAEAAEGVAGGGRTGNTRTRPGTAKDCGDT